MYTSDTVFQSKHEPTPYQKAITAVATGQDPEGFVVRFIDDDIGE